MDDRLPPNDEAPQQDRQSRAARKQALPTLTPKELAEQEATNTLLQYDRMVELIRNSLNAERFRLRPSIIQELNRISIDRIEEEAGRWRDVPIEIGLSRHDPPDHQDVPRLVDEMCDYVNDSWDAASAFHLAAYIMWRLNWIHPFVDGNGRTTRAVSYYVLCSKLGFHIPGVKTVPEMIAETKNPYYRALESADTAYKETRIDVSEMEELLRNLLAKQMVSVVAKSDDSQDQRFAIAQANAEKTRTPSERESRTTRALRSSNSLYLGALFGVLAILFFIVLVFLGIFGRTVPEDTRYLVIFVFAFSGALSTAFIGGNASARGQIDLPYLKNPLAIATTGFIATLVILLLLGLLVMTSAKT